MVTLTQGADARQQLRQHQEQQLSLQAQQRLQLLAMPLQALSSELRQRAEQNPFLSYEPPLLETAAGDFYSDAAADLNQEANDDYFNNGREGYGDEREWVDKTAEAERHDRQLTLLTEPLTLYRHLELQVLHTLPPGPRREQVLFICDALDADGYLRSKPHELLADWWQLHHVHPPLGEERDILESIRIVQTLDPPGVGARSLAECLELQVRADTTYAPERALRLKVCHRLNALLTETPERLARTLRCTVEEFKAALAYLRTLNPFPGRAYATPPPLEPPEVHAIRQADGRWVARCCEEHLPIFRVDEAALQQARALIQTKADRTAVADFEAQARLWTEAYRERNETLRRVAQLIFDRQTAFLESGGDPSTLNPLLQRDIAEAIGYDESTISRTLKEKMVRISTSRKPIPLKAFFAHALPSTGDASETISEQRAKAALKALIDAEDATKPYSDQTLMEQLAAQGIILARRTVAKYREQLGIPSTRERRRKL